VDYPVDSLTPEERALLAPHVTNLDRPVFALVGLPEAVKGALFARYSRYPGTLRRLMVDEFAGDLVAARGAREGAGGSAAPADGAGGSAAPADGAGGSAVPGAGAGATPRAGGQAPAPGRAAQLYERIFLGYGDDSVAQLGGAHLACEWASNLLTKILQRPRLAAYLEQSTRYIAYDAPIDSGRFRYYRDPALGPGYAAAMDALFEAYAGALPVVSAWAAETFPVAEGESPAAHARAVRAKALDLLRGLLPAASLSHMGIYASGQTYEQLILHLLAHPLPEAREYGTMILRELQPVIGSFLTRVERADRGGRWTRYLAERAAAGERWAARLGLGGRRCEDDTRPGPSVRLVHVDGTEEDLLCALLFESTGAAEADTRQAVARLSDGQRAAMLRDLVGERENRRHRPGRGFEALRYRFEIVADYGAFRDLQRHRMLTVQWQPLTPDLGAEVPEQVAAAGAGEDYRRALEVSAAAYGALRDAGHVHAAPYALCLAYRMRFVLDLNAREAMQLIELRSGREGHPSYRAVAHEMHALIAEAHPAVAGAMRHVDTETEPRLERILAEMRTQARATVARPS
jgi:thymidylate synthase ThyX